jgi:hypothetical protein
MKTVCILSYERTGTTWLCTALNTSQTWCIFEIFSRNPALFYWNLLTYMKLGECVPQPIIETFEKIFNPQNLFVDALSHTKIKNAMIASKPYTNSLLKSFQEAAYSKNRMLCFKIFPYHFDENVNVESIISLSDYVIINYRSNILETFLSWKLAIKTGAWSSLDKQDRFAVPTVAWDEKEYLSFYERIVEYVKYWQEISKNKPNIILCYEDIHNENHTDIDKALYVKEHIKNMGLDMEVSFKNHFQKQRDYSDLSKTISNFDDFKVSCEERSIPIFYRA